MKSLARRKPLSLRRMNKQNLRRIHDRLEIDESQGRISISFNGKLFKPEAIFQAAGSLFDRVQVLIDLVDKDIVVSLQLFDRRRSAGRIAREFCELVYSYSAYLDREKRTKDIRDELLGLLKGAKEK
jgi:hypothetical protein